MASSHTSAKMTTFLSTKLALLVALIHLARAALFCTALLCARSSASFVSSTMPCTVSITCSALPMACSGLPCAMPCASSHESLASASAVRPRPRATLNLAPRDAASVVAPLTSATSSARSSTFSICFSVLVSTSAPALMSAPSARSTMRLAAGVSVTTSSNFLPAMAASRAAPTSSTALSASSMSPTSVLTAAASTSASDSLDTCAMCQDTAEKSTTADSGKCFP
mmetsp:Transcript_22079/g.71071  ORF Transcript_22079/g.71071 Transcript_22079/m.71071 type:complete len:225 (-) Transcript_22079:953-1627(-)